MGLSMQLSRGFEMTDAGQSAKSYGIKKCRMQRAQKEAILNQIALLVTAEGIESVVVRVHRAPTLVIVC